MFAYKIEDNREYKSPRPELVAYCECCEKGIYEGDRALQDNSYKTLSAYICMECFLAMSKSELAEALGASFEEAF